jgi:hypothetical protein
MNTEVKKASEAQYSLYEKMTTIKAKAMEEKGITAISKEAFMELTSRQASDKINALQTLVAVFQMTEAQSGLIANLCERAGMPAPKTEGWTSKQASDFITKINAFIASKPALATDKQAERIQLYVNAGLLTMEGITKVYKVEEIKKLSKKDASQLCEEFEDSYRTWRDTHVTDKQIEYVQSLQERLGDAIIGKDELMIMTRETASELIAQLEKEWNNRKEYASQQVGNYKDLTDRSKEFEAKMKLSIGEREFDDKITMCNKLYVLMGQQPEGLETVGFNEVDNLVGNLVAMARMYVEDNAIVEALGLFELKDVLPEGAEA